MATRWKAIVLNRWKIGARNEPKLIDDAPSGVSITDITGQPDAILPCTPNIYIVEVDGLTDVQMTALNGMTSYFVLMSESYDDVTGGILSSTYDDVPTLTQLQTFKTIIQTRFPDVDDDKLTEAGRAILRVGLTRREILDELVRRWRRFVRA